MKHTSQVSAAFQATIEALAAPPKLSSLSPIGARAVYALRLIAAHQHAGRDPLPELVVRLGSVDAAAKALALSQALTSCWPENFHVSGFCCSLLSFDEAALGGMVDSAARCDRASFEAAIDGLIRADRRHRLWDSTLAYIAAESRTL